jgi:hypothetical protein
VVQHRAAPLVRERDSVLKVVKARRPIADGTMNYYVVLGIAEDADATRSAARFERWFDTTTPTPDRFVDR